MYIYRLLYMYIRTRLRTEVLQASTLREHLIKKSASPHPDYMCPVGRCVPQPGFFSDDSAWGEAGLEEGRLTPPVDELGCWPCPEAARRARSRSTAARASS